MSYTIEQLVNVLLYRGLKGLEPKQHQEKCYNIDKDATLSMEDFKNKCEKNRCTFTDVTMSPSPLAFKTKTLVNSAAQAKTAVSLASRFVRLPESVAGITNNIPLTEIQDTIQNIERAKSMVERVNSLCSGDSKHPNLKLLPDLDTKYLVLAYKLAFNKDAHDEYMKDSKREFQQFPSDEDAWLKKWLRNQFLMPNAPDIPNLVNHEPKIEPID